MRAAIERVPAVTGACMMMRTELARRLGGFDEVFVVGDFEDSDLCMKIRQEGSPAPSTTGRGSGIWSDNRRRDHGTTGE